jgi:Glucose-6-phosphate 1-dehydrogenase
MLRRKLALVRRTLLLAHRKALPHRASEIAVQFKDIPQILFNTNVQQPQPPNVLALRIQPEEGLSLRIVSRVPGTRAQTHPVEMDFQYSDVFGRPSPEAYERLLLDVMAGDASRFMRATPLKRPGHGSLRFWKDGNGKGCGGCLNTRQEPVGRSRPIASLKRMAGAGGHCSAGCHVSRNCLKISSLVPSPPINRSNSPW